MVPALVSRLTESRASPRAVKSRRRRRRGRYWRRFTYDPALARVATKSGLYQSAALCIYAVDIYNCANAEPPFLAAWRSRGGDVGGDGTHAERIASVPSHVSQPARCGAKRHGASLKRKPSQCYQCMTIVLPRGFAAR